MTLEMLSPVLYLIGSMFITVGAVIHILSKLGVLR